MGGVITKMLVPLLVLLVAGCGGEDTLGSSSGGSTGGTGGTGGSTNTAVRIGNGTGSSFTQGTLALGVSSLSAGGSTSVTANLVDGAGNPYTTSTEVTFNSTCASQQIATLTSPVTTLTGTAVSTYVAKGCEGNETITAAAMIGDTAITATATITVSPANLGSIQFVSVDRPQISLKGTGGQGGAESATVVFKVLNEVGGIAANRDVIFDLSTSVGGITLTPTTAKTDANGQVQTVVQSGAQATPVRVKATVAGTDISTQSDQLTITTGIPDQDSFSLAATVMNLEGWNRDGEETVFTARLSDHFSNPVPDGTVVNFWSEGGQIGGSCMTLDGACSVSLFSANIRPADGRVTVLAFAIGEESFTDYNGDSLMNAGEAFDVNGDPTDMEEAFIDYNEDGLRQATEPFINFNPDVNTTYDSVGDGQYNGVLCDGTAVCSSKTSINVRRSMVIVFGSSSAVITVAPNPINLPVCSTAEAFTNTPVSIEVTIADVNGNAMPAGTQVEFATTNGEIISDPPAPLADTVACLTCPGALQLGSYTVRMKSDATQTGTGPYVCNNTDKTGDFTVKVTSPSGLITTLPVPIAVND